MTKSQYYLINKLLIVQLIFSNGYTYRYIHTHMYMYIFIYITIAKRVGGNKIIHALRRSWDMHCCVGVSALKLGTQL